MEEAEGETGVEKGGIQEAFMEEVMFALGLNKDFIMQGRRPRPGRGKGYRGHGGRESDAGVGRESAYRGGVLSNSWKRLDHSGSGKSDPAFLHFAGGT